MRRFLLLVWLVACGSATPSTKPPEAGATAKKPAGAACDLADDCASGICEGQGCGPGQGVCGATDRMCTRDLRPYCGCDGRTFMASGTCPGQRFSAKGGCP